MDDFETGKYRHLPFAQELPYEFMQGYIGNFKDCIRAVQDVEIVFDLGMPLVPRTELKDFGEYLKIADGHWSKISFNDLSEARVIKAPTVFFLFLFFFFFLFLFFSFFSFFFF